jgi:hypothetical protein
VLLLLPVMIPLRQWRSNEKRTTDWLRSLHTRHAIKRNRDGLRFSGRVSKHSFSHTLSHKFSFICMMDANLELAHVPHTMSTSARINCARPSSSGQLDKRIRRQRSATIHERRIHEQTKNEMKERRCSTRGRLRSVDDMQCRAAVVMRVT